MSHCACSSLARGRALSFWRRVELGEISSSRSPLKLGDFLSAHIEPSGDSAAWKGRETEALRRPPSGKSHSPFGGQIPPRVRCNDLGASFQKRTFVNTLELGYMNTSAESISKDVNSEVLVSRKQVCARWGCCSLTLRRREAAGLLKPIRFNQRMLRYRLADIQAIENAAK